MAEEKRGSNLIIPLLLAVAVLAVAVGFIVSSLPQAGSSGSAANVSSGAASAPTAETASGTVPLAGVWKLVSAESAEGNPLDASPNVVLELNSDGSGKLLAGWVGGGGLVYALSWTGDAATGGKISVTDVQGEEAITLRASGDELVVEDESVSARFAATTSSGSFQTSTRPSNSTPSFTLEDALIDKSRLVGEWFIENVTTPTTEGNAMAVLYEAKSYGVEMAISLNADGTAAFNVYGGSIAPELDSRASGNWKATDSTHAVAELDGYEMMRFRLEQGRLICYGDWSGLIYLKKKA